MKFLHTADWHVGKTLRGRSRLPEQRLVLADIVALSKEHEVDAVMIAGDLYDTATPTADAQHLVVTTLLELQKTGAEIIAIAGNHDNAASFDAYRPLMGAAGIHLTGRPRSADQGGVIEFTTKSGEPVVVALLPFLSQRYAVKAADLIANTPADNSAQYDQRVREILNHLTASFGEDSVNIVMSHLTVTGGTMGGGERQAQSIFEYYVPGQVFGNEAHYVALGHLHRFQVMPASCPVVYCGAPLAIDFGEEANTPGAVIVELAAGAPAKYQHIPITSSRELRTVMGNLEQLRALADEVGDAYLRVDVDEPAHAGLRDQVMEILPNTLIIRRRAQEGEQATETVRPELDKRSPAELFADYCKEKDVGDARVSALFAELLDEVHSHSESLEEVD